MVLDRPSQVLIYHTCGLLDYGPKIYGSFNGGRLEEFIPCHTLKFSDLEDVEIRKQYARKVAHFHHLKLPLTSNRLDQLIGMKKLFEKFDTPEQRQKVRQNSDKVGLDTEWAFVIDWRVEHEWLSHKRSKIYSPDVLSTNDMNRANALIRDNPDRYGERVTLVDYELASMNPRGKDLGNHFLMWTIEVNSPDFLSNVDYPSEDYRREIIEYYLEESKKVNKDYKWDDNGRDSIEHLLLESEYFALQAMMFWLSFTLEPKNESNPMNGDDITRQFYVSPYLDYLVIIFSNYDAFQTWGASMVPLYQERKKTFMERFGYFFKDNQDGH